jgi:hypothetical protein
MRFDDVRDSCADRACRCEIVVDVAARVYYGCLAAVGQDISEVRDAGRFDAFELHSSPCAHPPPRAPGAASDADLGCNIRAAAARMLASLAAGAELRYFAAHA